MATVDLAACGLLIWTAVIAVVDWQRRKVPNVLLLAVLLPALAWLLWRQEGPLGIAPLPSVIGSGLGLLLLLPGYMADKLGAGDVKLATVMGLLLGTEDLLIALLLSALLLGAASLWMITRLGREAAQEVRMPAAVALCSGFAITLGNSRWGNLW